MTIPFRRPIETNASRDDKLRALATALRTPAYVYDLDALKARVQQLQASVGGFPSRLFFATMANDNPTVLRELASLGVGACVNSLKHLELARESGFPIHAIQFTSTALPVEVLSRLHQLGIGINLDSMGQVAIWGELGGRRAGLRVNAASLGSGRPFDRIGIDGGEVPAACIRAASRGIEINGLHVYVGTNLQTPDDLLPTLDAFFRLAENIESLSYLNIGGGIGVDYSHSGREFDVRAYGENLRVLHRRVEQRTGRSVEVILEPGRGMVAGCGSFLTRVTDCKMLSGKRYAGVDASVAIFPRPLHHPEAPHRIRSLREQGAAPVDHLVVGCTTYSRDILGTATLPSNLLVGDILVVDDAGAYSQSMMSRFLGQMDPTTVFLEAAQGIARDRTSADRPGQNENFSNLSV
jgi:diaminopimelate decarboxylase